MTQIILDRISAEELTDMISQKLLQHLSQIKIKQKNSEEYLTPKQVQVMLKVSAPTLIAWNKKNILKCHKLGSRVYYKASELELFMIGNEEEK